MHPEHLDRLLRLGAVPHGALYNHKDHQTIAERCTVEFALDLYSLTAKCFPLLCGRDPVTSDAALVLKIALMNAAAFLDVFKDRRLSLTHTRVKCNQVEPKGWPGKCRSHDRRTSDLPNPVNDDFTAVEWKPDAAHYDQFPHMILLVQAEQPRIYAVLPMDPALLCRADEGFEMAKIFSLYSRIDVCLVLGPEKCVYIRKDGTYKRSRRRPTGGALAHRSVTGPHLYSLHLEPLQATLRDRPDAFQWYDEFDNVPELFTSYDYSPVEPVISLSHNILGLIRDQVRRTAADFRTIIGKEWDGDISVLTKSAVEWARALDIPSTVRIIGKEGLSTMSSHPLRPSQFLTSPLHRALDGVLEVMECDLKRAGIYELVNTLLQPLYFASHVGYYRILEQSQRFAGPPDNETFWNRIQGQVFPAADCSPITLLRLETWRRIEHLYRSFFPPIDTDRGSYAQAQRIQAALPFLMKVNERGPMWMWQTDEDVWVMPAVVVRLDEDGEIHNEDGPAIIDPDGTQTFAIHGVIQS